MAGCNNFICIRAISYYAFIGISSFCQLPQPLHFIDITKSTMSDTDFWKAMVAFALTFPEIKNYSRLESDCFTDGLPFCHMLVHSKVIDISADDLDRHCAKWINKVSNLRKILAKIKPFFEKRLLKTDKIEDIDVVEIAKHASQEQLLRFFEVVMTVLLSSPSKEHYIQCIMDLDSSVQKTFVEIIRNSNPLEDSLRQENSTIVELEDQLKQLRRENADLKSDINDLNRKNKHLQREVKDLRDKLINCQEQFEMKKTNDHSLASDDFQSQMDKQKILIDNLKLKVLTTVRESEIEISHLKEEISALKIRSQNMEQVESTLEQYKELYTQTLAELQKANNVEKEKRKLLKIVQEKDLFIKKLQSRFEDQKSKQEDIQIKITEPGKKLIRSQKDIKRLKSEPSEVKYNDFEFMEDQKDEIRYLEQELNQSRMRIKQFEKENIKHRKKFQKFTELQKEKKRLERVITEINRSKEAEIEFLVSSLYDLRDENIRMFDIIKQGALPFQRKKQKI